MSTEKTPSLEEGEIDDEMGDEVEPEVETEDLGNGRYYRDLLEEREKEEGIHLPGPVSTGTSTPSQVNNKKRRLKAIYTKHPHIKPKRASALDKLLNQLTEDEIDNLLFSAQLELGAVHPFASGSAVTVAVGSAMEYTMGRRGLAQHLLKNTELVAAVDAQMPYLFAWDSPLRVLQLLAEDIVNFFNLPIPEPTIPTTV